MGILVLVIIAIIVISWFKKNNKQRTKVQPKATTTPTKTLFAEKQIQQQSIQLLESLDIIYNTSALDTLIGRIDFISNIYPTFLNGCNSNRYLSDVQIGIDTYKTRYYDRILNDFQIALLVKPNTENLKQFYADCIVSCYIRYVEKQELEMSKLVRKNAIYIRKEDIIKVGYSAKYVFKTHELTDNGHLEAIENIRKRFYNYQKPLLTSQ